MDQQKEQLLKQLAGNPASESAGWSSKINAKAVRDAIKGIKPKQCVDFALFGMGLFLVYNYGKSISDAVDGQMPDEKTMLEMMNSQQPGGMA